MSRGPIVTNIINQVKLGNIIKTTRCSMDMTQSEFSEMMHVPVSTLNNWESGINNPPEYFMDLLGIRFEEYRKKHDFSTEQKNEHINFSDMMFLNDVENIPVGFLITSVIQLVDFCRQMNKKLETVCDILSYNFDDGSELEDLDDLNDDSFTEEDIFCLNESEKESGLIDEDDVSVDISLYLASRDMTDEELNENYSPSVIRKLGRNVLSEDDFDEIDLSTCDDTNS